MAPEWLLEGETPLWITKGRTVLIQKDNSKENEAKKYCPITSLPLTWKLLTGIVADEIYGFLENQGVLPEEQKGCRRKSKGTADQLYTDKMLLQEVKRRKKNLVMIEYRIHQLWENLWHGTPLLGDRELNDDRHSEKCEFFGKKDEAWEGGANLWCRNTWGSTYQETDFSRGCTITVAVCNCHHTSDTHWE